MNVRPSKVIQNVLGKYNSKLPLALATYGRFFSVFGTIVCFTVLYKCGHTNRDYAQEIKVKLLKVRPIEGSNLECIGKYILNYLRSFFSVFGTMGCGNNCVLGNEYSATPKLFAVVTMQKNGNHPWMFSFKSSVASNNSTLRYFCGSTFCNSIYTIFLIILKLNSG